MNFPRLAKAGWPVRAVLQIAGVWTLICLWCSCGIPLVISQADRDYATLVSAMTVEQTLRISGFSSYDLPDESWGLEYPATLPRLFCDLENTVWLILPGSSRYRSALVPEDSAAYMQYLDASGQLASHPAARGCYIFRLPGDSNDISLSPGVFRPGNLGAPPYGWVDSNDSADPWPGLSLGILGSGGSGPGPVRPALLSRVYDQSSALIHLKLTVLDGLEDVLSDRVWYARSLPQTILDGPQAQTRIWPATGTKLTADVYAAGFLPPAVQSGTVQYSLGMMAANLPALDFFRSTPAFSAADWNTSLDTSGWWPYQTAATDQAWFTQGLTAPWFNVLPVPANLLCYPCPAVGHNTVDYLWWTYQYGQNRLVFSQVDQTVDPPNNLLSDGFLPQSVLHDGQIYGLDGNVWKVMKFADSEGLVPDWASRDSWPSWPAPLVFLYEYRSGTSWRLRFSQLMVGEEANSRSLTLRLLSISKEAWDTLIQP